MDEFKKLNKDFLFVFTVKKTENTKRKRILVSARSLKKYIGEKNANKLILRAKKIKTDKTTVKYRKYGTIEIYSK